MKNRIMKQKIVPGLGAFMEALFTTMPMLSAVSYASLLIVLYTSIRPWLTTWLPWVQLWTFFLLSAVATVLFMVLVYKFVLPSIWVFRKGQMELTRKDSEKLDEILRRLERLEKKNER